MDCGRPGFHRRFCLQYLVLLVAEVPILLVELIAYVFLLKEYSGSAGRPTPPAPISPAMPWVIFLSTGRWNFWPGEKICFTRAAKYGIIRYAG